MNVNIDEFRRRYGKGPGQVRPKGLEGTDWVFVLRAGKREDSFRAPSSDSYSRALEGLRSYLARNYPGQAVAVRLEA